MQFKQALAYNKPSERAMKRSIMKHHLLSAFGELRVDEIKMHGIETFKAGLLEKSLSRKQCRSDDGLIYP